MAMKSVTPRDRSHEGGLLGRRRERLPLGKGGGKKRGEEGLAFTRGHSSCTGEDMRLVGTVRICHILAASNNYLVVAESLGQMPDF